MTTAREVAQWMVNELEQWPSLDQSEAAARIEMNFGEEFIYRNRNGNPAISKLVLDEFEALTRDTVVWVRKKRRWRRREPWTHPDASNRDSTDAGRSQSLKRARFRPCVRIIRGRNSGLCIRYS